MDFTSILSAISSTGFPIVACVGIAWFFNKVNENYRQDIKEMSQQHKEEMQAMTEAVTNNTIALQKLIDKLGGGDVDDKRKDS